MASLPTPSWAQKLISVRTRIPSSYGIDRRDAAKGSSGAGGGRVRVAGLGDAAKGSSGAGGGRVRVAGLGDAAKGSSGEVCYSRPTLLLPPQVCYSRPTLSTAVPPRRRDSLAAVPPLPPRRHCRHPPLPPCRHCRRAAIAAVPPRARPLTKHVASPAEKITPRDTMHHVPNTPHHVLPANQSCPLTRHHVV